MPKYLFEVSYTAEGTTALLKEGGTSRRARGEEMIRGVGGKLEAFYYALGEPDAYTIADLPDAATAAAVSLRVNASGAVQLKTVALMTPEEIDQASKKSVGYRPPGT